MTNKLIHDPIAESRRKRREQYIENGYERGLTAEEFTDFMDISDRMGWSIRPAWINAKTYGAKIIAYLKQAGVPTPMNAICTAIDEATGIGYHPLWLAGARKVNSGELKATYKNDQIDVIFLPEWSVPAKKGRS